MNELIKEGLHFVALGGAEKVGMNMYVYMVVFGEFVTFCGRMWASAPKKEPGTGS